MAMLPIYPHCFMVNKQKNYPAFSAGTNQGWVHEASYSKYIHCHKGLVFATRAVFAGISGREGILSRAKQIQAKKPHLPSFVTFLKMLPDSFQILDLMD